MQKADKECSVYGDYQPSPSEAPQPCTLLPGTSIPAATDPGAWAFIRLLLEGPHPGPPGCCTDQHSGLLPPSPEEALCVMFLVGKPTEATTTAFLPCGSCGCATNYLPSS